MKVFITGGTGFIGSQVVKLLLAHGHDVTGLAHSDHSAQTLAKQSVKVVRGSLNDVNVIAKAAAEADGVIHLAFTNDFTDYAGAVAKDIATITAIGDALVNTNKPFVNTSGTLMMVGSTTATEHDHAENPVGRAQSEALSLSYGQKGVRAMAVRLAPTVHNAQRQGFGTLLAQMAVKQGKIGYVGDGNNVWPSVHRDDAAKLFVDTLEHGEAGATYNAVAEKGIPVKDIMTTIGETLQLPIEHFSTDEAAQYFGWFTDSVQVNNTTSSDWTQSSLNWHPTETGLLTDLQTCLSNPAAVAQLKR